jgi:hypothetical protein
MSEKVEALKLLLEQAQGELENFHARGCPGELADQAKAAFDRKEKCKAELAEIAFRK